MTGLRQEATARQAERLHVATIEAVRTRLAEMRAELPTGSLDLNVRGAAVITDDVIATIDGMLVALIAPPVCTVCEEARRAKVAEAAE